ncbi:MAG: helix-turn-helix domain-containing protein [Sandaracinaceae bacterium]
MIAAAGDPSTGIEAMTELVYSADNPLLAASSSTVLPGRGAANASTWASPHWHVMLDLLEAKRNQIAETSTLPLADAAELLGLSEDAVRKAAITGTLAGEKRGNRWFVTPGSVATYRERVQRRGRWPATPLRVRCGSEDGYSLSVRSAEPGSQERVRKGVVDVTIPQFERVLVRLRWTAEDGTKARRVLVLEPDPSAEPFTYRWPQVDGGPGFFVEGRFRIAQKFNNGAKAAEAWKAIEPA